VPPDVVTSFVLLALLWGGADAGPSVQAWLTKNLGSRCTTPTSELWLRR
jgi:hypothetical protein